MYVQYFETLKKQCFPHLHPGSVHARCTGGLDLIRDDNLAVGLSHHKHSVVVGKTSGESLKQKCHVTILYY